jgi:hypothetical protein
MDKQQNSLFFAKEIRILSYPATEDLLIYFKNKFYLETIKKESC